MSSSSSSSSNNNPLMTTVKADKNGRAIAELSLTEREAEENIFKHASQGWNKQTEKLKKGLPVQLVFEKNKSGAHSSTFSWGNLEKTSDGYVLQFQELIEKRGVKVGDSVCFKYKGVAAFFYVLTN